MSTSLFDFYYGDESEQFTFYRIPRQLITGAGFKKLSIDAKLLYGILLDRMSLSVKNGWFDELGRVYIYYTLDEIQDDLCCGHDKATKLLVELDSGKGFGLIERIRQGQGKPTRIYVKKFTTQAMSPTPEPQDIPRLPLFSIPDCGKAEVQTAEKPQSRVLESRSLDCGFSAGNYIKSNQTDLNKLNPSIYPLQPFANGWIDRSICQKEVEENIGCEMLCQAYSHDDVDEIVTLITDVLSSTTPTIRIGGDNLPCEQVRQRFQKLDYTHLVYVFDCLKRNTTQVANARAYVLTALYNAPTSMNQFYQLAVQHDLNR